MHKLSVVFRRRSRRDLSEVQACSLSLSHPNPLMIKPSLLNRYQARYNSPSLSIYNL